MLRYLLDTNICIFLLRGQYNINEKIKKVGVENCCISEITKAELLYGAECSGNPKENKKIVNKLFDKFEIIKISDCIDIYAVEKHELRKKGLMIDDFDLLIASTAIKYDWILVTDNIKHFARFNIKLENWIKR